MAHFARIEQQPNEFTNELEWKVQECIVISNDVPTSNGPLGENDMHPDGEAYVKKLYKHMYSEDKNVWKQYSYHGNFRENAAGKSSIYLETADKFITAQPYASWRLGNDFAWKAPVDYPTITEYNNPLFGQPDEPEIVPYHIRWDEDQQNWYGSAAHLKINQDTHVWNVNTTSWDEI